MLPSVPATSLALQANQKQASPSQTEADAPAQDMAAVPNAPARATAGPTSSTELLGLSGQLRLGESLSVFAETLGSLLKLPRREGEALTDYSKRLAAAINALNATERAKLQAQLNQIMQGATLRLLAELLKDPSGPAAARLAVQIEIAQYQGKDLAAGHAVNSYRQNNGSEAGHLPANANIAKEARGDPSSAAVTAAISDTPDSIEKAVNASSPTATSSQKYGTASIEISQQDRMASAEPRSNTQHEAASEKSSSGHQGPMREAEGLNSRRDTSARLSAPGSTTTEVVATIAPETRAAEEIDSDVKPRPSARTADASKAMTLPVRTGVEASVLGRSDARSNPTGTIYDAAALIRHAHDEGSGIGPQAAERIVSQFVTEWVSELLTAKQETRELRQALTAHANAAAMGDAAAVSVHEEGDETGLRTRTARSVDGEPVIAPPPNALPTPATPPNAATIAQQADTAFEKALLGMMLPPREPLLHPLVPHAGAQDFDDGRDHEIKRKPAVGDDGQPSRQGSGGGHSAQGEEQAAQAEDEASAETVLSQIAAESFIETDVAPVTNSPKDAPQQHLSNRPEPSAEDFYRQLATLE